MPSSRFASTRRWIASSWQMTAVGVLLATGLGWGLDVWRQPDDPHTSALVGATGIREQQLTLPAAGVSLSGTLTLPAGRGPFPTIILISGAGVQERDGVNGEARDLAVVLADRGIASLRTDDRGSGGSTGSSYDASLTDLSADVEATIDLLTQRSEVGDVGLLGASQGALVAAEVAGRRDEVAFLVLLSSPALVGRQVILDQAARLQRVAGMPEATINALLEQVRRGLQWLEAPIDEPSRRRELQPIVREMRRLQRTSPFAQSASASSIEREIDMLTSVAFRSLLDHDPRLALRRVRCPALAIYGELDLQVAPEIHRPALEAALAAAPTDDVTIVSLPGLNHLLQPATTGLPDEYTEGRRSARVFTLTASWIAQRTRSASARSMATP